MSIELLQEYQDSEKEFTGIVETLLGKMDAIVIEPNDPALKDFKDYHVVVLRANIKGLPKNSNLLNEMAKKAVFKIMKIQSETKILFCSAEIIDAKNELIKELKSGKIKTMKAIIPNMNSFQRYGVFLSYEYDGDIVPLLLPNDNFSAGPTRCMDELSVGEEIEVEVDNISDNGKITVKAVTPFEYKNYTNRESLETMIQEGNVESGIVVGVHPDRSYVRVASFNGEPVDAICGVDPNLKLEKNSKVAFAIESILEGDESHPLKIRGRIIRVFKD